MQTVMRRALTMCAVVAVFAASPMAAVSAQQAPLVRGRLQRIYPNGAWFAAPGFAVTLMNPAGVRSLPVYSGYDGMYYFNGVPGGQYTLEVWVPRALVPFVRVPIVIQYQAGPVGLFCDVPPVNLP